MRVILTLHLGEPVEGRGRVGASSALLPLIADGGRILNVSSGLARITLPGNSAYAAAKGGVEVLTRYLARELVGEIPGLMHRLRADATRGALGFIHDGS